MSDTYSVEDWILGPTSTVYMDGSSVYHLREPGKPGIVVGLVLFPAEAEALRTVLQACLDTEPREQAGVHPW